MAKGLCGVCGIGNCRFEKTSPYKKMLSAYHSGQLELMYTIYWRSFGGLYPMMKPKLGGPVGILGYGLILAGIGSLIDDSLVEKANKLVGL